MICIDFQPSRPHFLCIRPFLGRSSKASQWFLITLQGFSKNKQPMTNEIFEHNSAETPKAQQQPLSEYVPSPSPQENGNDNSNDNDNATETLFEEVNRMYTIREAVNEAKRCLHCKVPQCKKACPIENNIPDFIHELSMGNMGEAMNVLHEKTNLPAICGRVCPHENNVRAIACWARRAAPSESANWRVSSHNLTPTCN